MKTREDELGIEEQFLLERVDEPTLGRWCSGFTAAKNKAEELEVPLFAVWSNGDTCENCVALIKCLQQPMFKAWMSTSRCIFWFGCSSDTSSDDKLNGTGYKWTWKNKSLPLFPFVRLWWWVNNGLQVDVAASGHNWTCGRDDELGASKLIANLNKFLASHLDGSCAGGDCGPTWIGTDIDPDVEQLNPCPEGDCVPPSEDDNNKPVDPDDYDGESSAELQQRIRMLSEKIEEQDRLISTMRAAWSKVSNDIQQISSIMGNS